jgi:hypothetical protein
MKESSTVWNAETLETQTFSLSPREALIAAYEQSKGNNNTWTYNGKRHNIEKGRYGLCLGDFWVSTGEIQA